MLKDKRGQITLATLSGVILTFIIVVVLMSVGGEVQVGTRDAIKNTVTYSFTNESITPVLNTNVSVPGSDKPDAAVLTNTFNAYFNDDLIDSSNYTIFANGNFQILNTSLNNTAINVTYDQTQSAQDEDYNISSNGLTGLDNMSGKLGLLGTIIILAAVLGIVVSAFAFSRGGV